MKTIRSAVIYPVHVADNAEFKRSKDASAYVSSLDTMDTIWRLTEQLREEHHQEPWESRIELLRTTLSGILAKLGVRAFCYQIIHSPSTVLKPDPGVCLITTFPESWMEPFISFDQPDSMPFIRRALNDPSPFGWSRAAGPEKPDYAYGTAFSRLAAASAEKFVTFPIHAQHDVAALTTVASKPASSEIQANSEQIYLIGHYFHAAARRIVVERALTVSRRRTSLLSPRETEMLESAAKGMMTTEIATHARISPKSVEAHLESARKKLHAANRTHAVVKAIMIGIIAPNSVLPARVKGIATAVRQDNELQALRAALNYLLAEARRLGLQDVASALEETLKILSRHDALASIHRPIVRASADVVRCL